MTADIKEQKPIFKKIGFCSFIFEFRELKLFKPIWTFQNQTKGFYLVFSLNKAAITWFFARNSSLAFPGCQPCLPLMRAEKYRTSDQWEEMSEIHCKVSVRAITALPTLYKSSTLMRSSSSIIWIIWNLKVVQLKLFHTDCLPRDFFDWHSGPLSLRLCSVPSLFVFQRGFQMTDLCV